jgi:hypothetical protein
LQNDALLIKHLHKFYNPHDIPWVKLIWFRYYQDKVPHASREVGSLWWKDIWSSNNLYRGFSCCIVGNGATICFWEDRWADSILSHTYPRLASFALSPTSSVKVVMEVTDLDDIFILPFSEQAILELGELQEALQAIPYDEDSTDIWKPKRSKDYTAKIFYNHVYDVLDTHPIFKIV